MKKILTLLMLIITGLASASEFAGDRKVEAKIIEQICTFIMGKDNISVFITDGIKDMLRYSHHLKVTDNCEKADILILTKKFPVERCGDKPIFTTKYYLLHYNHNIVGALYWHKGRPNIILIRERLEKFNITPPQELIQFIESEKNLW
ncbi:hypothetical protein [Persephonella sp.]